MRELSTDAGSMPGSCVRHVVKLRMAISGILCALTPSVTSPLRSPNPDHRYTYGHQDGLWEHNLMHDSG